MGEMDLKVRRWCSPGKSLGIGLVLAGGKLTMGPVLPGDGLRRWCRPRPGRTGLCHPGSAPRRVAAVLPAPHPGRVGVGAEVEAALPAPRPRPQVCAGPALPVGDLERTRTVEA